MACPSHTLPDDLATRVFFSVLVCLTPDIACTGNCEKKGMAEQLCGNYTIITDRQGRNALKGAIAFEGYGECELAIHFLLSEALHTDPCDDPCPDPTQPPSMQPACSLPPL